jgi:hypothetical protein
MMDGVSDVDEGGDCSRLFSRAAAGAVDRLGPMLGRLGVESFMLALLGARETRFSDNFFNLRGP